MTRDDVIRMAREAEATVFLSPYYIETLERFAALVAAEEREACALVCESRESPGTGSVAILRGAAAAIRARGQS